MRLTYLFDMEFRYSDPIDMLFPFDGRAGQGFGGGDGTVIGDRVRGSLKWSNWPRVREDGVILPDLNGIIVTDDGARILFESNGYSLLEAEGRTRRVIGGTMFMTDHEDYRWLNTIYAVQTGAIDLETGVVQLTYHQCVPGD